MTKAVKKSRAKQGPAFLPGDPAPSRDVDAMIRVDQAGEYGAKRIYAGQLAVLRNKPCGPVIQEMADQEQRHLDTFNEMIVERRVRPTALTPIWHAAGYALGAATAMMGEKAAMACTVAVEEVIDEHYAAQYDRLGNDEADLKATIEEFRLEELEHRDIGYEHGAEQAAGYPVLTAAIKRGSKLAIWLSERI